MQHNTIDTLRTVLKEYPNAIVNKQINHTFLENKARAHDETLLSLLYQHLPTELFLSVGDVTIFNTEKFISLISYKSIFPNSYTKFKNYLGLATPAGLLSSPNNKDVVLNWPFKDCILEGGQAKDTDKRDEVFYNETIAHHEIDRLASPKVFTNSHRMTADGKKEVGDITDTDNFIIKGNNLLVLYSLQKTHRGKVKLIYIDPPYNTGNDSFLYNDRFNHSTWLTFMKNRLDAARTLLSKDGMIFIQCDDTEHAYLKVMMDEIFGRVNFITNITANVKTPSGLASGAQLMFNTTEYILVYRKSQEYKPPIGYKIETGVIDQCSPTINNFHQVLMYIDLEKKSLITKTTCNREISIYKMPHDAYNIRSIRGINPLNTQDIYAKNFYKIIGLQDMRKGFDKSTFEHFTDNGMYVMEYTPTQGQHKGEEYQVIVYKKQQVVFLKDFAVLKKVSNKPSAIRMGYLTNLWNVGWWSALGAEGGIIMKNGKKPERLLHRIIDMCTEPGDIVLDYHLGSGTTAAVAHKMGRRYIGIEQMDYIHDITMERMKRVIEGEQGGVSRDVEWKGGGECVYMELLANNQIWQEKIDAIESHEDFTNVWRAMQHNADLKYQVPHTRHKEIMESNLPIPDLKCLLYELLDKNQLYVNLSERNDSTHQVSQKDKETTAQFYKRGTV